MNFDLKKKWKTVLLSVLFIFYFGWIIYCEIKIHYFEEFNGGVIGKEKIPPKKMPEIIVKGASKTFHVWKWKEMDFDSVMVGDSIVKRKYESKAFWYRKNSDGTFRKVELTYWTD